MAITIEEAPWAYRAWDTLTPEEVAGYRAQAEGISLGEVEGVHTLALRPFPFVVQRPNHNPVLVVDGGGQVYRTVSRAKAAAELFADRYVWVGEDTPPYPDPIVADEGHPSDEPFVAGQRAMVELARLAKQATTERDEARRAHLDAADDIERLTTERDEARRKVADLEGRLHDTNKERRDALRRADGLELRLAGKEAEVDALSVGVGRLGALYAEANAERIRLREEVQRLRAAAEGVGVTRG